MELLAGTSLIIALVAQLGLGGFALVNMLRGVTGRALFIASLLTLFWVVTHFHPIGSLLRLPAEILAALSWQALLLRALGFSFASDDPVSDNQLLRQVLKVAIVAALLGAGSFIYTLINTGAYASIVLHLSLIILYVSGLMLVEQLARNVISENRWRIRYLNIGLTLIFGYGLLVWSMRLALGPSAELFVVLHPLVVSLSIPFLIIASLRNRTNRLRFNLSRQFVFRTGVLAATGIFLIALSLLTYIGQLLGGDVGLTVAVFLGIIIAAFSAVVIGSTRFRSTTKVLITKALFESRYDYREEWTRFTQRLAETGVDYSLEEQVQRSLAETLHAKGASLWLLREGEFHLTSNIGGHSWPAKLSLSLTQEFKSFYADQDWVLDMEQASEQAAPLTSSIVEEVQGASFVVPLFLEDALYGLCFVTESEVQNHELDWEDFDILKLIAYQGVSFLALSETKEALIEHEKFAAVAQMSAFLVHDIKTINAQLSLLLENAARHKGNPAFIDDMLSTIANTVERMSRISSGLSNPGREIRDNVSSILLVDALRKWHLTDLSSNERIAISNEADESISVPDEYLTAINHLAQNALESSSSATLLINAQADQNFVYIKLTDTGPGMSQDFITNKLFEPFQSSKGVTGMGIGAYQAKSIVEKHGGRLKVESTLGIGTQFTIVHPQSTDAH